MQKLTKNSLKMNNLQSILFQKYKDKNLASLYIANYDSTLINPEKWANDFINLFTKIEDHPDVLKLHKDDKENEYRVESKSIREFLKFINYRPLQLEKKFIFIFDAHDISTIVSNKLLKVFEELGTNFCLFLMVPDNAPIMPTVSSRAIKIQIQNSNAPARLSLDFSAINTPQELLAFIKQNRDNDSQIDKNFIEQIINNLLSQSSKSPDNYSKLNEILKILSDNEIFNSFNNSKQSRMARFFP